MQFHWQPLVYVRELKDTCIQAEDATSPFENTRKAPRDMMEDSLLIKSVEGA